MVAVRIVAGRHDLAAVAAASPGRYPGLLESVAAGTPQARWDILFALPEDSLRLDADGGVRDAVLANAPQGEHGFFTVPKVIE